MKNDLLKEVRIRFRDERGQALRVEVLDRADGALVDVMGLRETADWLSVMGFSWVEGSNGIWARGVGHG